MTTQDAARKQAAQARPAHEGTASKRSYQTLSGHPIQALYGPRDLASWDPARDLGEPGQFPFTRGVHATMYRTRTWTMRQFAGFGTARDTNERFRYLLEQGQTGLSTAFDMPTLMGYDADSPRALGEVGREGVAISTLDDMRELFAGIKLDQVSTSMTINAPASIIWAMYLEVAAETGCDVRALNGTLQNDILKEYMAQNEWIFPPEPSLRLITDLMAYSKDEVPKWNTISVSGYHIREAGATAAQELAFTLANGFTYVERAIAAGMAVDDFAPRLSFFFDAHIDFFEEIAKFRAARRIWARRMRDVYGAKDPRSWALRFHTQTAGVSLTAQQPENNIVRTAFEALSAVLGGTQSLHTNALDEVLALPTEKAARIALRTQQLLAEETGVANVVDPLAGSYFVEAETDRMEREAEAYFARIEELGGVVPGLSAGFFQKEIANAAYRFQRDMESGARVMVGVNKYQLVDDEPVEILKIDPRVENEQLMRVRRYKANRDEAESRRVLDALVEGARGSANTMPLLRRAVRAGATLGEVVQALKGVFGEHREIPVF